MNADLLRNLKEMFGTVSSQTETSGIVAVRNVTAARRLVILADAYNHTCEDVTASRYPRLVRVSRRKESI